MNKKMLVSLVVGAAAGVYFFTGVSEAHASETDGVWTPRTVDQIKADISQSKGNKYTIVWGDTLSMVSQATNLTVQKLVDLNKIANADLIYAGNTLVFEGNVVTAKNDKGETVAQTVIQPKDKNDATKPVGKQESAKQVVSEGVAGSETTTTQAPEQSQVTQAEMSPATSVESASDGTTGETNQGTAEAPAATTPTTPTTPETTPAQPAPTSPSENQPTTPATNDSDKKVFGTIDSSLPEDRVPINIGNSGMVFDTEEEATAYGYAQINDENSKWYGMRFSTEDLVNKDYRVTGKRTVSFTEDGSIASKRENK